MPDFAPHSTVLGLAANSPVLGGITNDSYTTNTETTTDGSGASTVQSRSISKQEPVYSFSTQSIAAALDVIPPAGICLDPTGTLRTVTRHLERKRDCADGTPASNEHAAYLISRGLVTPQGISANRGETATLSLQVDMLSDGTNAPFLESFAATLPTSIDLSQYVVGAIRIGNVSITDMVSTNIAFNNEQIEKLIQLAGIWPVNAGVSRSDPGMVVTGRDIRHLTSLPLLGTTAVHTDTEVWFRKRKNASALEDTATAVHFKITMSGMVICDDPGSSSPAATTFAVKSINDGTNFPIIITTDIAYVPGF